MVDGVNAQKPLYNSSINDNYDVEFRVIALGAGSI